MESQKVRIINEKGEARLVMPHIARDKKIMKSYGYRIQDLNVKEDSGATTVTANAVDFSIQPNPETELDLLAVAQTTKKSEKEARAEYEAIFGKKAGNKKLETILKEIKEKK